MPGGSRGVAHGLASLLGYLWHHLFSGDGGQDATCGPDHDRGDARPLAVLAGACAALCLATFLGVMVGSFLSHLIPESLLRKAAGGTFIIIGGLILMGKW